MALSVPERNVNGLTNEVHEATETFFLSLFFLLKEILYCMLTGSVSRYKIVKTTHIGSKGTIESKCLKSRCYLLLEIEGKIMRIICLWASGGHIWFTLLGLQKVKKYPR